MKYDYVCRKKKVILVLLARHTPRSKAGELTIPNK